MSKPRSVSATGFVIKSKGENLCFLTNRHVVDCAYIDSALVGWRRSSITAALHLAPIGSAGSLPRLVGTIAIDPDQVRYHSDQTIDLAGFKFPRRVHCAEDLPVDVEFPFFLSNELIVDAARFEDAVQVGEVVAFPGYPEWYDKNGDRPVLRTGTIVSDPRSDFRMKPGPPERGDGNSQIAFEAFSYSGNSGSPVFVMQRGMRDGEGIIHNGIYHPFLLVGINAGHVNSDSGNHSGLSYMYKSTAILDFLDMLDSDTDEAAISQ